MILYYLTFSIKTMICLILIVILFYINSKILQIDNCIIHLIKKIKKQIQLKDV